MSISLFKRPDSRSLRLWALACLLPALALVALTRDIWFAPRSVVSGIVTSKSFRATSPDYGSMHLSLQGQPYDFAAPMKIVAVPERRPPSNYGEVRQGSTAAITVFTRDIAAAAPGAAIPVLRVDQSGRSVFLSGDLWISWVLAAVLLIAAAAALLGMTINTEALAASGAGRFLLMLDRPARRLAQAISPLREFDTMERQVRHERALAIGRIGTFIVACIVLIAAGLLIGFI
jgi:hypothetical protein